MNERAMASDLRMYEAATPEDLARLRVFIGTHDAAKRLVDRHVSSPRYRPALTRLAERDGALVGAALLSHRRLHLDGATIDTGSIDHLVAPDGEPDLAAMLGDCLGALVEEGLPLATLRGDTATFAPFGFAPFCFAAATRLPVVGAKSGGLLRPIGADDLEDLAALYASSYRDLPLSETRVAPDWRAWLVAGPNALALEDNRGRLIAYARISADAAPAIVVDEAAAADAGAARTLVAALRQRALAASRHQLELVLAPQHLITQAALYEGAETCLHASENSGAAALAGVVDLPGVLQALGPAFERRLTRSRYAGWTGNLRAEIETERIVLAFQDGHAEVIDGSRPADVRLRRVALTALAQLCLGYRAAADLRAEGGLDCDDSALGLIDTLFPVAMAFGT